MTKRSRTFIKLTCAILIRVDKVVVDLKTVTDQKEVVAHLHSTTTTHPVYTREVILAAWDIYIDISTMPNLKALKASLIFENVTLLVHNIRETLKRHGPNSKETSRVGIDIINNVLLPFISEWSKTSMEKLDEDPLLGSVMSGGEMFSESKLRLEQKLSEKSTEVKSIAYMMK